MKGNWHGLMRMAVVGGGLLACAAGPVRADDPPPQDPPAEADSAERSPDGRSDTDDASDIELLELELPMVVSAARHEQAIASAPYAVSVVTAADIRSAGARSVPDALRLVPGVDVADLSFGNSAVSPRGLHGFLSRQTLVLVDGRQIFDSFFGGTVWGSWPFQLEDIERIEVIRGPAGVTWGANAMNGVINIITKDPRDQLGLTLTGSGSSRGGQKEHLGYALEDGKLRLRVSGEYEGSDGFARGRSLLRPLDDSYKGGRFSLHAIYEAGPNDTLTLSAGSSVVDDGFPPALAAGLRPGHPRSSGHFVLGRWVHRFSSDNVLESTVYVNDFHVSPGIRSVDYRYQQFAFQVSHTFKPAEQHTLTWGVDTRADLTDAGNSDPMLLSKGFVSSGIFGLYAHDEWRLSERWQLDVGARIDYETYGGFQPSGRAALSYRLSDDSSLYGAVSRAFQMPPAALRFLDVPFAEGLLHAVSDRELRAQTLVAYELGYRGRFHDVDVSLAGFWHEYFDLTTLSPRTGPPGLIALDEDNRASGSLYGIELDGRYAVTRSLTLLGNYTYQQLNCRAIASNFGRR